MAQFPLDIGIISNVTLSEYTPQYFTESLSLKTKARDRGIHQFQGELTFTVTGNGNQKALRAFLLKTKGRGVPIQIPFPGNLFTSPDVSGIPLSNGPLSMGATTLSLDSFTGEIGEGDVFTILNDTKVYTVVRGGVGPSTTIDIYPPLRTDQLDNTPLNFIDVNMNIYLTDDVQTVIHNEGGIIHDITLGWKEAL